MISKQIKILIPVITLTLITIVATQTKGEVEPVFAQTHIDKVAYTSM